MAQNKIAITEYSDGDISAGSRAIRFYNAQSTDNQWVMGTINDANSNFYITNGSGNLKFYIDEAGKVTVPGNMQINNNLTVYGTTTFINTEVGVVEDPQLELGLGDPVRITKVQRYLNLYRSGATGASGYFQSPSTNNEITQNASYPWYVFTTDTDVPESFTVGSNLYVQGTNITGLDGTAVQIAPNFVSTSNVGGNGVANWTDPNSREFAIQGSASEISADLTFGNTWTLTGTYTYAGISSITPLINATVNPGITVPTKTLIVGAYDATTTPALPNAAYTGRLVSLVGQDAGIKIIGLDANNDVVSETMSYNVDNDWWTFSSNQYVSATDSIILGPTNATTRIDGAGNDLNLTANTDVNITGTSGCVNITTAVGDAVRIDDTNGQAIVELGGANNRITYDGTNLNMVTNGNEVHTVTDNMEITTGSGDHMLLTSSGPEANFHIYNSSTYITSDGTTMNVSAPIIEFNSSTITYSATNITYTAIDNLSLLHGNQAGDHLLFGTNGTMATNIYLYNSSTYVTSDGQDINIVGTASDADITLQHGTSGVLTVTDGSASGNINIFNSSTYITSNGSTLTEYANNINLVHEASGAVTVSDNSGSPSTAKIYFYNQNTYVLGDGSNVTIGASTGSVIANHGDSSALTVTSSTGTCASIYLVDSDNHLMTDTTNLNIYSNSGNVNITGTDDVVIIHGSGSGDNLLVQGAGSSNAQISLFNDNTYITADGTTLIVHADILDLQSLNLSFSAQNINYAASDNLGLFHGNQSDDHIILGSNSGYYPGIETNVWVYNGSTYISANGTHITLTSEEDGINFNHSTGGAVSVYDSTGANGTIDLIDSNHRITSDGTDMSMTETTGNLNLQSVSNNVNLTSGTNAVITTGATGVMYLTNGSGAQFYLGASDGDNRITTDNTDIVVTSDTGDVKLTSNSGDVDLSTSSGLVHMNTSGPSLNLNLYGTSATYVTSDGTTMTLNGTNIENVATNMNVNVTDIRVIAQDDVVLLHGNTAGDHLLMGTDGTMSTNVWLYDSSSYLTSCGSTTTMVASTNLNFAATGGNYNFTNTDARLVLNSTGTYIEGDGTDIEIIAAANMNMNTTGAGNVSINLGGTGDINLFTQTGSNVNLTIDSALTFDGGDDEFYINYNGNNYLIIHGNNIEAQGNFVSVAIGGSSDQRLKENIRPLENALDTVQQMRGVNFTWIKKPEAGNQIGFIAQEIEALLPELTLRDSSGFLAVQYGNITALLVEAVKDQQRQMAEMRSDYNSKIALILEAFQAQSQHIAELSSKMSSSKY